MYSYTYILHYELIYLLSSALKRKSLCSHVSLHKRRHVGANVFSLSCRDRLNPYNPCAKQQSWKRACILTEVLQYYLYEKVCNLSVRYLLLLFHLLVLI